MRWSELAIKECIDLANGEKLGNLTRADLEFDPASGQISKFIIPGEKAFLRRRGSDIDIHWSMIKKLGPATIIVDSLGSREMHLV